MSRNTEYQFVSTDTDALISGLISAYELITGASVQPPALKSCLSSGWQNIIVQERVLNNYTGNQNIPSRAEGDNLDALGELFYDHDAPGGAGSGLHGSVSYIRGAELSDTGACRHAGY